MELLKKIGLILHILLIWLLLGFAGWIYCKISGEYLVFDLKSDNNYVALLIGIATITFTFSAISIWASFLTNVQSQKEELKNFRIEIANSVQIQKNGLESFKIEIDDIDEKFHKKVNEAENQLKEKLSEKIYEIAYSQMSDIYSSLDLLILISDRTTIETKRICLKKLYNNYHREGIVSPPSQLILSTLENYYQKFLPTGNSQPKSGNDNIEEKFKNELKDLLEKWGCKLPENNEIVKSEPQPNQDRDTTKAQTNKGKKDGK
ncbi:hypothetical protein FACS189426_22210 [Bacteroidia bacterium]|nr:hypothetical protein FACS189426_22210 [Bacteroidia bacterium]